VKYLLVVLVVVGVLWLMSVQRRINRGDEPDDNPPAAPPPAPKPPAVVPIVACARCGVHLPEPEAVRDGEQTYCSRTHQLLGARQRQD
jgi:uncharacterized protein